MTKKGEDYLIYSQRSLFDVEKKIVSHILSIWPSCIITRENDADKMLWLFFERDIEMANDDNPYEIDATGEGSFSIISNNLKGFDATILIQNDEREPMGEVKMILNSFWEYAVVLPAYIEDNKFSKKIYDIVVRALSEDIVIEKSETQNTLIPKPASVIFK